MPDPKIHASDPLMTIAARGAVTPSGSILPMPPSVVMPPGVTPVPDAVATDADPDPGDVAMDQAIGAAPISENPAGAGEVPAGPTPATHVRCVDKQDVPFLHPNPGAESRVYPRIVSVGARRFERAGRDADGFERYQEPRS